MESLSASCDNNSPRGQSRRNDMQKSGRPKRPRALQACEVRRARKNRCNEEQPCSYCVEHDIECVYSRPHRAKRRTIEEAPRERNVSHEAATRGRQNVSDSIFETASARFSDEVRMPSPGESPPMGDITSQYQQKTPPPPVPSVQAGMAHSSLVTQPSLTRPRDTAADIMDTNLHTRNLEFYGASSSVAFLRHVENISDTHTSEQVAGGSERSLASMLHNTNFQPYSTPSTLSAIGGGSHDRFHFRVARRFIDAYFSNIHYIQPLFDEEEFLTQCEDLWFDKAEKQPASFIALYYSTLSLGSLVMVWDQHEIYGADRFSWSRRFFKQAVTIIAQLGSATDLEMVQCYYMMAKVCQHELNPHVAYLYSGQAARTALAIGLNRSAYGKTFGPSLSLTAAKTWWAVYCVDIQTSFALGRPDSLGPDEYHTQDIPGEAVLHDMPYFTSSLRILEIIPCMVKLSRIMRRASLRLYTLPCTLQEKVFRARELDTELDRWFRGLPFHLRQTEESAQGPSLKLRRDTNYINKQSVVLMIRYHNLRMIVYAKFLTISEETETSMEFDVRECQNKCMDSAGKAIDVMYDTFRNDSFFQTWWYNSTYTLFAVSILLTGIFHGFANSKQVLDILFTQIDHAIAVLEAMDECIVTRNATSIIKKTLARAKKAPQKFAGEQQNSSNGEEVPSAQPKSSWMDLPSNPAEDPLRVMDPRRSIGSAEANSSEIDWINAPFPNGENQQGLFWVEWGNLLNDLGA